MNMSISSIMRGSGAAGASRAWTDGSEKPADAESRGAALTAAPAAAAAVRADGPAAEAQSLAAVGSSTLAFAIYRSGASVADSPSAVIADRREMFRAIASAMDANGDRQISQEEADAFRTEVDGGLFAAATRYNAGGAAGLTDEAKALAMAMDADGDRVISQDEADGFRSGIDSKLFRAATDYNAAEAARVQSAFADVAPAGTEDRSDMAQAIAMAMDADGDRRISQDEADAFRTRIDGSLFAAATTANAGEAGSSDRAQLLASAMDLNGDRQVSQEEADAYRNQVDGVLFQVATAYNVQEQDRAAGVTQSASARAQWLAQQYAQTANDFARGPLLAPGA